MWPYNMLELLTPGATLRQFFAILPGESNLALKCSIFTTGHGKKIGRAMQTAVFVVILVDFEKH